MRLLDAAGHRAAVVTGGDAADPRPPVLLLPGVTLPVTFWPATLPSALGGGRRWASLSLPAHAPSTLPPGTAPADLSSAWFAAYVDAAAEALWGDAPVVAVGYSTGAFAALCTAVHRPARVAGVASVSGFVDGRWGGLLGAMQLAARGGALGGALFELVSVVSRASRRAFRLVFASHARRPLDRARFDAVFEAVWPLVRDADAAELRTFFAGLRPLHLGSELGRIDAPLLVLHGERDIVPRRDAEAMATVPGARLVVLPRTGHLFFAECWPTADAELSRFLDETG